MKERLKKVLVAILHMTLILLALVSASELSNVIKRKPETGVKKWQIKESYMPAKYAET